MNIFAYIYDFISFLFEEEEFKKEIRSILLFGSVASGEYDEESDIDLFIDIQKKEKGKEVERLLKGQIEKFEELSARIWYPRGIKNKFSIIVGDIHSPEWKNIRYDAVSNGKILYGKYEGSSDKKHWVVISFSPSKLKQSEKMQLARALYGYELKRNGKKYIQKGMLDENGGIKLSVNTIVVPIERTKEFRKLFTKYKVTPEIREIWMR